MVDKNELEEVEQVVADLQIQVEGQEKLMAYTRARIDRLTLELEDDAVDGQHITDGIQEVKYLLARQVMELKMIKCEGLAAQKRLAALREQKSCEGGEDGEKDGAR